MKWILLFVLVESIKEYSFEYEDYHHNGLRLNFEDELSNNEDMRNSTVFPEKNKQSLPHWNQQRKKHVKIETPFDTKK